MMTNSCFKTSSIVPSVLANHGAAVVQASITNASYGIGRGLPNSLWTTHLGLPIEGDSLAAPRGPHHLPTAK
jgi:hypothetical protein